MSTEPAIIKQIRRRKQQTEQLLDDESFYVSEAKGKLAAEWGLDFVCFDKGCYKLVKVFHDKVEKKELDRLLNFSENPYGDNTIIQLIVWGKNSKCPVCRVKLKIDRPDQNIPDRLKRLVK